MVEVFHDTIVLVMCVCVCMQHVKCSEHYMLKYTRIKHSAAMS